MTDEELAEAWVGENGFGSDCNNINSVDANREMVNAFLAGLKAGRPKKKNAELKSIADFQTSSNMDRYFKLKRSKEQIAEAKEIIREYVKWANWQGSGCPSFKSIQDKAEAFLNSEVEK